MRRSLAMSFVVCTVAACATTAPLGERELTSSAPCVPGDELLTELVHALDCVAVIDGDLVTPDVFNSWARALSLEAPRLPPESMELVKSRLLASFVDGLLLDRDIADVGFVPTEEERERELALAQRRVGWVSLPSGSSAKAPVEGSDEWGEVFATRGAFVCRDTRCVATSAEIRSFYDDNVGRFSHRDEVQASHIVILVSANASAAEDTAARQRAAAISALAKVPGADFAALARTHSQGPTAPRGGELGFFPRGRMVKPFDDAAFAMAIGEVSPPVRTRYGWHVLYVSDRKNARVETFEEVRDDIGLSLELARRVEAYKEAVTRSRGAREVEERPESLVMTSPMIDDVGDGARD